MPRSLKRQPEATFYRELGRNLRAARTTAGKSQKEIAKRLDTTFQQIGKYENGTNRIPVDRLVTLAAYLEVPLLDLIALSDSHSRFQSVAQFRPKEFRNLMEAWGNIKDRQMRAGLLNLVKRMADLNC